MPTIVGGLTLKVKPKQRDKMKISLTMKCPDVLNDAIEAACETLFSAGPDVDAAMAAEVLKAQETAKKWFRFGETVNLTIDTDAETCVVESV